MSAVSTSDRTGSAPIPSGRVSRSAAPMPVQEPSGKPYRGRCRQTPVDAEAVIADLTPLLLLPRSENAHRFGRWASEGQVEAAGIEPASRDSSVRASTCVASLSLLVPRSPTGRGPEGPVRSEISPEPPRTPAPTSPVSDLLQAPPGEGTRRGATCLGYAARA